MYYLINSILKKEKHALVSFVLTMAWVLLPRPVWPKVLISGDAALQHAFPTCQVKRKTVFLTEEQQKRIEAKLSNPLQSAIVYPYELTCPDKLKRVAYFDVHRVRTLSEKVMGVVDKKGILQHFEVLSFDEPPQYLPPKGWYQQLVGKEKGAPIRLKADIDGISGATLSAKASTQAARLIMATHAVLYEILP